jgi:hypothetical protein
MRLYSDLDYVYNPKTGIVYPYAKHLAHLDTFPKAMFAFSGSGEHGGILDIEPGEVLATIKAGGSKRADIVIDVVSDDAPVTDKPVDKMTIPELKAHIKAKTGENPPATLSSRASLLKFAQDLDAAAEEL